MTEEAKCRAGDDAGPNDRFRNLEFEALEVAAFDVDLTARRALGDDLTALAERFGITETSAALRLGEVTGQPLAVVAPSIVRVRGEEWAWPDESTLRRWARKPVPGLRKTRLTDDPRRVVLDVDEVAAG